MTEIGRCASMSVTKGKHRKLWWDVGRVKGMLVMPVVDVWKLAFREQERIWSLFTINPKGMQLYTLSGSAFKPYPAKVSRDPNLFHGLPKWLKWVDPDGTLLSSYYARAYPIRAIVDCVLKHEFMFMDGMNIRWSYMRSTSKDSITQGSLIIPWRYKRSR